MNRIRTRVRRPAARRAPFARAPATLPATPVFWVSALLLTLAFAFGGASRGYPMSTLAIELVGVGLIMTLVWARSPTGAHRPDLLESVVLAGLCLVPVLQLAPLPPSLWTALPGRQAAVETLRIAGITPGWAPISLDPEATFRSLLWLIPPVAVFLATRTLDAPARFRLAGVVLGLCIASLVLGGLQMTDRSGVLFGSPAEGGVVLPIGFFANRNHQGIAMAAALPFAAAFAAIWGSMAPHRTRAANMIFAALLALLIVGVLVTRSRAALTLAGPMLIASLALYWTAGGAGRLRREAALMIGAGAVLLVVAAQFALSAVFDRFETLAEGDARFDIWKTTLRAAADVAPLGSGLGAFESFYRIWEPLALLRPEFTNHAHNDYLELWLEAGWLTPLLLTGLLLWLGRAALRSWSGPATPIALLARAGGLVVIVLLAHSVVDYPLRTQALACLLAFAAGCASVGKTGRPTSAGERA